MTVLISLFNNGLWDARGIVRRKDIQLATGILAILGLCHCGDSGECPVGFECTPIGAGGAGGGAEAGGGGGTGGEGGSDISKNCNPTEGAPIEADCGVFVKSGSNGDGTQASPFGSITGAVQGIGSATRIYVCGGDTFTGSVELPGGVSLYGGFDCSAWSYGDAAPKPTINGDVEEPALKIMESGTSVVQSMKIESPDAGTAGSSSIAVMVSGATVRFDRCSIRAGDGAAGAPGVHEDASPTPSAANAFSGANGCIDSNPTAGGPPGQLMCNGSVRDGGVGGSGGSGANGGGGDPGNPAGANNIGGKGETSTGMTQCGLGGVGDAGMHGNPGAGAMSSELGTVDENGYQGASGQDGLTAGDPGQGGGGGGGGNGCGGFGPGGGGGGAGGCGGLPGQGGGGGGGSFGLVILAGSDVTLVDVTVKAGAGGMGGAGDSGQEGMEGGTEGGPGTGSGACSGGAGGKGGQGGAGGGGRGGPSVAIAYVGDPPTEQGDNQVDAAATPAAGGDGGDGGVGNTGGPGAEGATAARLAF